MYVKDFKYYCKEMDECYTCSYKNTCNVVKAIKSGKATAFYPSNGIRIIWSCSANTNKENRKK